MKLIVLSDIHLDLPDQDQKFPDNLDRLEAAIERINAVYCDADLVVFAGDLVDRGRLKAPYETFKAALTNLSPPYALTLGNHDDRDVFCAVFGKDHCDEGGFIQSAHDLDGTHVLILDSSSDLPPQQGARGARHRVGQLCQHRLGWLSGQLKATKGQPTIIILHHPPLQLGISTDAWVLQQPEAMIDLLVDHGNVRHVISGHIHMTSTAFYHGIPFTTLAGNCTTAAEDVGRAENRGLRAGPGQMAVVITDAEQTTVHFDNYADGHPPFSK